MNDVYESGSTLTAGDARRAAREWVTTHADQFSGLVGAYTAGSVNALADDATFPATSDIDIMVVIDSSETSPKPGKFRYRDVLLEVTCLPLDLVRTPEQVLSHYHLAPSLQSPMILADPTGYLARLQSSVVKGFARPAWVERRIRMADETVVQRMNAIAPAAPLHEQTMSWLFAAGGVPHILLVAGLRNPTVRRRYEAVADLLHERGRADFYPELLQMLGADELSTAQVSHRLDVLENTFDAASDVARSPFFFASDISPVARSIAIDGSREMIARGCHREAMFWIAVTFTRCQQIMHADAPSGVASTWDGAFRAMLADLGIHGRSDIQRSAERISASLPVVRAVAGAIMDKTLKDDGV